MVLLSQSFRIKGAMNTSPNFSPEPTAATLFSFLSQQGFVAPPLHRRSVCGVAESNFFGNANKR